MKKYIAPAVRAINLETEALVASSMRKSENVVDNAWSNERDNASSSIWGED